MNEEWKFIKGFEGFYQVSNFGNVSSIDRYVMSKCGSYRLSKGIVMKQYKDKKDGYLHINLRNGKLNKVYQVHRLVAEAFIPNPDNLPQVNHKDEDKTNNHVDNLEWCSLLYNIRYGTGLKRKITNRCKKVYQYTLDGEFVREWESVAECGRNGFKCSSISLCCNGKRKTHKNYILVYEKN